MDFPFRTKVRTFSAADIAERNQQEGRTGVRAFPPPDVALEECRTLTKRRTRRALRTLVQHPDERVFRALLRSPGLKELARDVLAWFHAATSARALVDAQKDGVLWNPLLDATDPATTSLLEFSSNLDLLRDSDDIWPGLNRTKLREARVEWIASQTDPASLLRLISAFRARRIHEEVARHAAALSPEVIRRLRHNRLIGALFRNPHLPESERSRIRGDAIRTLAGSSRGMSELTAESILEIVQRGPNPLTPSERAILVDCRSISRNTLDILLTNPTPLEPAELIQLMRRHQAFVTKLATHRDATAEVWREALTISRDRKLRLRLAKQAAAVADETIRRDLSRSSSSELLKSLLQHVPDEEYPALFKRLIRLNPQRALQHLESPHVRPALITQDLLLPLLESSDSKLRLGAIAALGQLRALSPEVAEPPRQHRTQ